VLLPLFVTLLDRLLFAPLLTVPYLRACGEALVEAVVPVPESGINCGLLLSESFTTNVPVKLPVADGLKFTPILQLAFEAKLLVQVLLRIANMEFVVDALLKLTAVLPWFVNVTVWVALAPPLGSLPKLTYSGE